MKKQLEQMRQMMQNMQSKHAAEIEALQKRIKELENRPAGLSKKDQERIEGQKKIEEKIDSLVKEMKAEKARRDLDALRSAAKARAAEKAPAEKPEETVFKAGSIGQQAMNPEISVAGDMFYRFVQSDDEAYADHWTDNEVERSGFFFRVLDFHVQSYLDPYSRFKAAVEVHPEGAELGEAYFTRFGVLPNINVTAGKFRQQFGVVNRWHLHSLDQVNFPLPIQEIFGPEGLNQTGVSIDWRMPKMLGASQGLTFQVTNASNERLFTGEFLGWPAGLVHYKNYRDLSKDTYLELGATGLFGPNSRSGWRDELGNLHDDHGDRATMVLGADATLFWEPTEKMKYRNLLWRSEFYYLNKHVAPFDNMELGQDIVEAYGAYSYIQTKIARTIDIGFRADMYRPDTKDYFIPHFAYIHKNPYRWQVGPYITWQQSPWVKFRLEYNHLDGMHMDPAEDRVFLQCVFTAGPHKHDRY
ncbi:MAG: hypothetical protein GXP25_13180 [Planctomycetes bacterium]|nr:hypothetical protein [Planctomycetota bacterium]